MSNPTRDVGAFFVAELPKLPPKMRARPDDFWPKTKCDVLLFLYHSRCHIGEIDRDAWRVLHRMQEMICLEHYEKDYLKGALKHGKR